MAASASWWGTSTPASTARTPSNPADSPAEQQEQKTIREASQRALDYARNKGVLPVAAAGNEATDLGNPTSDDTSSDYPVGTEHPRAIDNSCLSVPTESNGVVAVTSTGISTRKAYISNSPCTDE